MATVTTIRSRMPAWVRARYTASYFIDWINNLLQECSGKPWLFKELRYERGFIVDDYQWIDPPSNCREIHKIFNPQTPDQQYNFSEVNGRVKLEGVTVGEEDDPTTASVFANSTTGYIDVNVPDALENQFKNYLLYVTAGTLSNTGFVIDRNDASAGGTCRVYYKHPLSTALSATQITAASLINYNYYVLMQFSASYDEITAEGDEVPIRDAYERQLTKPWLEWAIYKEIDPTNPQASKSESDFRQAMIRIKRELRTSTGGRVAPRRMPGLDMMMRSVPDTTTYAEPI